MITRKSRDFQIAALAVATEFALMPSPAAVVEPLLSTVTGPDCAVELADRVSELEFA